MDNSLKEFRVFYRNEYGGGSISVTAEDAKQAMDKGMMRIRTSVVTRAEPVK